MSVKGINNVIRNSILGVAGGKLTLEEVSQQYLLVKHMGQLVTHVKTVKARF